MTKDERVELLKDAIDVSGNRLLDKDISLEKVSEQMDILDKIIYRSENGLQNFKTKIYIESLEKEKDIAFEFIEKSVIDFYNFDKNFDSSFWSSFGSAPYYQIHEDEKGEKGGVGMNTIFGNQFEDCHSIMHGVSRIINVLQDEYNAEMLRRNRENVVSEYSDLDDLEDNVVAKKIYEVAEVFYKDTTKSFDKRLVVFEKYGFKDGFIHEPKHPMLKRIFDIVMEFDYFSKHEEISCTGIIEIWVEALSDNRIEIDHSNSYHPDIIKSSRNYEPSEEAIERLTKYYSRLILDEGVASFIFDW